MPVVTCAVEDESGKKKQFQHLEVNWNLETSSLLFGGESIGIKLKLLSSTSVCHLKGYAVATSCAASCLYQKIIPGCHYKSDYKLKLLQFNNSHFQNFCTLKTSPDVCYINQEDSFLSREDILISFKPKGHQNP